MAIITRLNQDEVRVYDTTSLGDPESGMKTLCFYPPLGEVIVADTVSLHPSAEHAQTDIGASSIDHLRIPPHESGFLVDTVKTLLRREGRTLRHDSQARL